MVVPLVVCAAVAAILLLAAFQLLSARRHLQGGLQDLRAAVAIVHGSGPLPDGQQRLTVRRDLAAGEGEFVRARDDLRLWSPVLAHLGWVPRLGGQLVSAQPAADASFYATRSALHLLDGLTPLWPAFHAKANILAHVTPPLAQGSRDFALSRSDADRAAAALVRLPAHSGNTTLDSARARLASILPVMRATSSWLASAPMVLGIPKPSSYLLVFQDPAELRATGGFIGAAEVVTLDHGSLRTSFTNSSLPHEIDSVSTPLPEDVYTAEGPWIFRDSNWSPDFSLSARMERWFYGEDTGQWVDGVVGVVDTVIEPILAATGPVYVPAYHQLVDANNIEPLSEHYVHGQAYGGARTGTFDKVFLRQVTTALLQRIQSLPSDRWLPLGTALSKAVARGDIALYDRRPTIESNVKASGADGGLAPVSGDFLFVVDDNRSYNKLNPFVHETGGYQVLIRPDGWLDATLTLRYHVGPVPTTLFGAGPAFGLLGSKYDYQDFLRVFVPRGARLVHMTGVDVWAPAPAYGLTQFAGRLLVRRDHTQTVTIRYRVPPNALAAAGNDHYALTLRHQPGGNLAAVRVSLRTAGGVTLVGAGESTASFDHNVSLARDARLTVPLAGDLRIHSVPVPARRGPLDPYIPFSDFRDPHHPL